MPFTEWESFYVIVGSSAAALTGLMFVVMALIVDFRGSQKQIDAFGTPTVVHFGTVLLLSAIMSAPWSAVMAVQFAIGSCGAAGFVYTLIVVKRARQPTDYTPVFEDWLFHAVLPITAYAAIFAAAVALPRQLTPLLFVVGAAAVLLLFVGIHNAWDTVTYIVVERWERRSRDEKSSADPPGA